MYVYFPLRMALCAKLGFMVTIGVGCPAAAYRPIVSTVPLISFVLNAYSGRYADALSNYAPTRSPRNVFDYSTNICTIWCDRLRPTSG